MCMEVLRAVSARVEVSHLRDRVEIAGVAAIRGKIGSARRSGVGLSHKFIEALDHKLSGWRIAND
jgi:hypothetical protein